jgi:pSer/pThr/pTyr-binding forkhead associated (FHA) protein
MKLVIEDGAGTRSVVPFADEVTLGRGQDGVTFRLADRNVSRRHARFLRQNGTIFVEDLGSLLGTLVNGERIEGRRRLREGDVVQIGDYDLAVLPDEGAREREGAPPPLPHTPRPPSAAAPGKPAEPTRPVGAHELAASAAGIPAASRPRGRVLRSAALAGLAALAAGTAIGFALGRVLAR